MSTARVVAVGGASAARGGATLQLVGGVVAVEPAAVFVDERNWSVSLQPQVIAVEPPRAAARKRPAEKQATRVIAYNVRIVSQGDEADAADETQTYVEARSDEPNSDHVMPNHAHAAAQQRVPQRVRAAAQHQVLHHARAAAQQQVPNHAGAGMHHEMPGAAHAGMHRSQHAAGDAQFVMPNRAHGTPDNAQFEQAQFPMPSRAPHSARFDMPNTMPRQRHLPNGQDGMPLEVPAGMAPDARIPGGHVGGAESIPMSLFGALEDMGGALHEQGRRAAARAQAPAAAGYKQLLAQQLEARHGGLFSNRNMCIAVGAYAFVLFLLAFFG